MNLYEYAEKNLALAQEDWKGVTRIASNHIRGIRNWAIDWTRGVCAGCGLRRNLTEMAHIVGQSANASGKGYVPFNIYAACKGCNDFDREVAKGDPFMIIKSLSRPDLVIPEILSRKEALRWDVNPEKEVSFIIRDELMRR